jgi:hypothetical protein
MLALRLQEIEKVDEAEVSPVSIPSDMMLQCERQGIGKASRLLQSIKGKRHRKDLQFGRF